METKNKKENKESFVDYYSVLQIWPTASEDVIKKSYFALAKLHHPDISSKTDENTQESDIDFKLINEAYAILSDQVKRRVYDEQLKNTNKEGLSLREEDKRSAKLAFEQAKTAMKHNRYDKAAVLLNSAIKYDDSNPAYYSWYGFALAALKTKLHEARDACKKALEIEFYNADYHANLGYVYSQAGLTKTAMESFREALKWDPEHPIALKYLHGGKSPGQGGLMSSIKSFFKSAPK
jgi:curved DNA-binding protein CbpA